MSLINEALKQAQNQRTVVLTSTPTPAPAAAGSGNSVQRRITKRPPPLAAGTLMGLLGGGLFGLLAVGGGIFLYFFSSTEQPAPTGAKPPHSLPAVAVTSPQPPPPLVSTALPLVPGPFTPVVAPTHASKPPAAAATPMPAKPNPRISEFIEALRISVVRLTPTDPKVILNGQVFRLNAVIDRHLQVRLVKIEPSRLVFTDANGFDYTKPL